MAETCHDVVIAGGGIGGLAASLALSRRGHSVRVLERNPTFAEIGAGLQLAPNATRVLDRLGVLDDAVAMGVLPRTMIARNAMTGRELSRLDLRGSLAERYGAPYLVMHRADLLEVLLQACKQEPSITLEADRLVETVQDLGDRAVVTCADGSAYEGRLVVGADGLHSHLRSLISRDAPINSGYVAYRGAVPVEAVSSDPMLDAVVVWFGPGLHLVQYPLRSDGSLYNQVAVFRSDQYRDGRPDWGGPEELRHRFSVTRPEVRAALSALGTERRWEMYDREPLATWSRGRIVLLGDAAHPMLQYLAQGSCQALEDAAALAEVVSTDVDDNWSLASVTAAMAGYEGLRNPRASLVQRTARVWGDIWHTEGLAMSLRDEAFGLRATDDYTRIDWLYGPPVGEPAD